jgi:hypothetical protein
MFTCLHAFASKNVFKITPGGVITQIMDNTGDGIHTFIGPDKFSLAVNGTDVYVASFTSSNAFKIAGVASPPAPPPPSIPTMPAWALLVLGLALLTTGGRLARQRPGILPRKARRAASVQLRVRSLLALPDGRLAAK